MTLHDLLKARFASTRKDLNSILDRLADEDVTWAPKEGMRTIGGQLVEIVDKEREVIAWIQQGEWPEEIPTFDRQTATIAEIRTAFDSIRAETLAYLDSLTESQLQETISAPENWWEALRLRECPKHEILRNIAAHEWYHTGQLISYLWIRGDDPYKW